MMAVLVQALRRTIIVLRSGEIDHTSARQGEKCVVWDGGIVWDVMLKGVTRRRAVPIPFGPPVSPYENMSYTRDEKNLRSSPIESLTFRAKRDKPVIVLVAYAFSCSSRRKATIANRRRIARRN